ncbi:1-acyl-sn-glycerol-3-phosphate acyltransferase [Tropicimonas sp. IMCC6043]|uniref:lysophospholipid acyltransferase family protein n=1 Tax=Tropicimonas sp. IMCC6043 TaxID=2510645 RepID=UPI00101E0C34|nr:lysophospholipid acyltransferase family protein [Tropicimonas sp. IMCC6043]RYH10414.1 1-acyl-sn-glycerol-3-phosphate acyltransferase [Tropicimonas sp. IMCC6043]
MHAPAGAGDWLRVLRRGVPLLVVIFGCLALLLIIRLVERPLFEENRPWTPSITRFVCRTAFVLLGIRRVVHGEPMTGPGAQVSNHVSWLDIFALNASDLIYFVSKSEVARWPGIGWLARATGTLFIDRNRNQAQEQAMQVEARLAAGHRLLLFPEGTSTDGRRVLPFKPTLFQPFFSGSLPEDLRVQPVSLVYHAPEGEDARFYGWWGDMDFGSHCLKVLRQKRQGSVEVQYHPPIAVAFVAGRKVLAAECGAVVRRGVLSALTAETEPAGA